MLIAAGPTGVGKSWIACSRGSGFGGGDLRVPIEGAIVTIDAIGTQKAIAKKIIDKVRKHVKVLANFLGAAKELTGEYVDLAEITDDEQNQIRMSLASRPDRKITAKLTASFSLSGRSSRTTLPLAAMALRSRATSFQSLPSPRSGKRSGAIKTQICALIGIPEATHTRASGDKHANLHPTGPAGRLPA